MSPSAEEVADVLDKAHDEMLLRGRSRKSLRGLDGSVCIVAACGIAARHLYGNAPRISSPLRDTAVQAVDRLIGYSAVGFNFYATDDEVFDALRNTAKALRNGELEVT